MQHTSSELRVSVTQTNMLAEVFTDQRDSWSWAVRTRDVHWQLHPSACLSLSATFLGSSSDRRRYHPWAHPSFIPVYSRFPSCCSPLGRSEKQASWTGFTTSRSLSWSPPAYASFSSLLWPILIFYYRISISADGWTQRSLVHYLILVSFYRSLTCRNHLSGLSMTEKGSLLTLSWHRTLRVNQRTSRSLENTSFNPDTNKRAFTNQSLCPTELFQDLSQLQEIWIAEGTSGYGVHFMCFC